MPALPIRNRAQGWIRFLHLPFAGPTPLKLTYRPVLASLATHQRPFGTTHIPDFGGLYAIMVHDATCHPLPYRLIYVGEAGKLSERVCRSHEKYASWERAACGAQLFIAFHCIPNESERKAAERQLIEHYRPECNRTFNSNPPLGAFRGL